MKPHAVNIRCFKHPYERLLQCLNCAATNCPCNNYCHFCHHSMGEFEDRYKASVDPYEEKQWKYNSQTDTWIKRSDNKMRVDFLIWDKETETFDECDWVQSDKSITTADALKIFKEHLNDSRWLEEKATILMINYGMGEYKLLTVSPPDSQYEVTIEA